jgi:hypothetical protein
MAQLWVVVIPFLFLGVADDIGFHFKAVDVPARFFLWLVKRWLVKRWLVKRWLVKPPQYINSALV